MDELRSHYMSRPGTVDREDAVLTPDEVPATLESYAEQLAAIVRARKERRDA